STVPEGTASSVKERMDCREEASRKATCPPVRRMVYEPQTKEWFTLDQSESVGKKSMQAMLVFSTMTLKS
ncbi:hypothetical protein ACERJO_13445, partial [Halalkalibacter sp. AB-rgal2]|uniref:hypothetical protein n=1 Tax=Halalkalibacter sp. AB-rgal2 TaxID=3242695 RepID=UPI00359D394F